MVEALTIRLRYLPLLVALGVLPTAVYAHRLDEYLQATLVAIEPGDFRLHINLTPGVEVADRVLALIDRDRDGVISTNESAAYGDVLKRDLTVQLDRRNIELKLTKSNFPEPADLRTGWGIIQIEYSMTPSALVAGAHNLTIVNRHLPTVSAYLFNAAKPKSGFVQITRQVRNTNQSSGKIEFTFHTPANFDTAPAAAAPPVAASAPRSLPASSANPRPASQPRRFRGAFRR